MNQPRVWIASIGVVALVTASSLAVYNGSRARVLQQERDAALAATKRLQAQLDSRAVPEFPLVTASVPPPATTVAPQPVTQKTERVEVVVPDREESREQPRRRGSEWLEELKTTDPERYAAIQKWREDVQTRMQDAWAQKTNFFTQRDTSKMTEAEFEEYSLMVKLMNDTWALGQRLMTGVPREERWQVMSTIHSNMTALSPLLENERDREFRDLAIAMGQTDRQAREFVTYANQILSNTSVRALFPSAMRGHGFGGNPGGRTPLVPPPATP